MKKELKNSLIAIIILTVSITSCKKGYLDASPDKSLATPTSSKDLQSLLDNPDVYSRYPGLGDLSSDNYYLKQTILDSKLYYVQNCYTWTANTYLGGNGVGIADWTSPFNTIYICNVVLDAIPKIKTTDNYDLTLEQIKGEALFIRAFTYFSLAQIFSEAFTKNGPDTGLGLPVKLNPNLDNYVNRSTVKETYNYIVNDLNIAKDIIDNKAINPATPYRPTKIAVFALLARTYLVMQDYENAEKYSDSCLKINSSLLDYNPLDSSSLYPFPKNNPEIYLQCYQLNYGSTSNNLTDTSLYASYDVNDLRRKLFFTKNSTGNFYFRGTYSATGGATPFGGLTSDEIYLIKAECQARSGNSLNAMSTLNTLLSKRWKNGTFQPYVASNNDDALKKILIERRKELLNRGLRWSDLKRLNQDTRFAITLIRNINNTTLTLLPNDSRYTLLIPFDEINLTGINQTKR